MVHLLRFDVESYPHKFQAFLGGIKSQYFYPLVHVSINPYFLYSVLMANRNVPYQFTQTGVAV